LKGNTEPGATRTHLVRGEWVETQKHEKGFVPMNERNILITAGGEIGGGIKGKRSYRPGKGPSTRKN